MKKMLFVVCCILCLAVSSHAIDLPNLEGSQLYDFAGNRSLTALTSRVLSYKDIDLRVGYAVSDSETVIASLSYDLDNLKSIQYCWSNLVDLTIGVWSGYDFKKEQFSWGLLAVFMQIDFQ